MVITLVLNLHLFLVYMKVGETFQSELVFCIAVLEIFHPTLGKVSNIKKSKSYRRAFQVFLGQFFHSEDDSLPREELEEKRKRIEEVEINIFLLMEFSLFSIH